MKRFLALILACIFAFTFVACNSSDGDDSSAPAFTASGNSDDESQSTSKDTSKDTSKETSDDVSAEVSGDASADTSDDVSGETSDDGTEAVVFTNKYISWNGSVDKGIVGVRADDATSIKISKFNDIAAAGDVAVYTNLYGDSIKTAGQDFSEFAIAVFEYDKSAFDYLQKSFADVGEGDAETKIPSDGYVLAIHKDNANYINNLKGAASGSKFYPHGFVVNNGLNTQIEKASKAPTIDGKVDSKEYGDAIWEIEPDNKLVSYAQFEVNNYYSTATVYLTYDKEYLYLGVVVDSPYHENTITETTTGNMYNFESIQVNVTSVATTGDYISEHWDNIIDATAVNENVVRQYGFCVNDEGTTYSHVWMGQPATFSGTAVCMRDDKNLVTVYEAAIPWSECGSEDNPVDVTKGGAFGFSVSINSGNNTFKNIYLRDGGGIIGLNDWTKVPTITFG